MLAPAAPFVSDWIHRALEGTSVHLAAFPVDHGRLDADLDAAMDAVRRLASLGRAARETATIRVRQPLATMRVAMPREIPAAQFELLEPLLRAETNVRAIEVVASDASLVRLRAKGNFRALGKRFGKETPAVATAILALQPDALRILEGGGSVHVAVEGGASVEVLPDEVTIEREVVTDWPVASEGRYVVALDPRVTDALAQEGLARELVNRIQRLRKDAGFDVSTRIVGAFDGDPVLRDAAIAHRDYIARETLMVEFEVGPLVGDHDRRESVTIDDHAGALAVRRVGDRRSPLPEPAPAEQP